MDWSPYYDVGKTSKKFGLPENSKSSVVITCSCGGESVVDFNSLKARYRRNKNNNFQAKCGPCTRSNQNRLSPEIISLISVEQTRLRHGIPKNKHDLVVVPCLNCSEPHSIKVSSLTIRIWEYRKKDKSYSYTCKKCQSKGSFPEARDVDRVVDFEKTKEKFGLPKLKRDKVVATCISCTSGSDIRLDSLKNAIRSHKKVSSEPFTYICRACYAKSEAAKEIRSRASQVMNVDGFCSNIEIATQNVLESLGIKYKPQFELGYYTFDFFLPDHDVLVEVQGEYWHSTTNGARRDSAKFTYVDTYFPNRRVLYLHERDFFNPKIVEDKVSKFLSRDTAPPKQNSFLFKDVVIREFKDSDRIKKSRNHPYVDFMNSFHYSQYGRKEKLVLGAFLGDDFIAVCKFASVVRKEVATSMEFEVNQVAELDRLCIHPNFQKKNFASWFVSRCSKVMFEKFSPVQRLVSFADSNFGHVGTVYKASNWAFLSETNPSYFYLSPDGFVVHKKKLYEHAVKMGMKEREYVDKFGYEKRKTKKKYKFTLDRK